MAASRRTNGFPVPRRSTGPDLPAWQRRGSALSGRPWRRPQEPGDRASCSLQRVGDSATSWTLPMKDEYSGPRSPTFAGQAERVTEVYPDCF